MEPKIALKGTKGEIQVKNERGIFKEERRCHIVVVVNTKGRAGEKFNDEIELAKYKFKQPVVALIQKGSRPSLLFSVGMTRIRFTTWRSSATCRDLIREVSRQIVVSRPPSYVPFGRALPRRVVFA